MARAQAAGARARPRNPRSGLEARRLGAMLSCMIIRTLRVERTARLALSTAPSPDLREVWLLLHGYAQSAPEFLESAAALEGPGRLLVAPEGLSRFYRRGGAGAVGASWMTREERDDEIADYVRYLDRAWELVAGELASGLRPSLLGFSQGAATASRWSALGTPRFARVVLWGGAPAPELDPGDWARRLAGAELVLVRGRADEAVTADDLERARIRLAAGGLACELRTFEGGHELEDGALRAVAG